MQDAAVYGRNAAAVGVRRLAAAAAPAAQEVEPVPLYTDAVLKAPETQYAKVIYLKFLISRQ